MVAKSTLLYRRRRATFIASRGGACETCGSVEDLEIDHVDPELKLMSPGAALMSRAEIREPELAKCQILCSDCHATKTREHIQRTAPIRHGTNRGYQRGCKCSRCLAAHAAMNARYR